MRHNARWRWVSPRRDGRAIFEHCRPRVRPSWKSMRPSLLVLVAATSCGGAAATTELQAPAPPGGDATTTASTVAEDIAGLNPGEALHFDVKLAGVLVGEASLAVGKVGTVDGRRAIGVSSRITAAGALA